MKFLGKICSSTSRLEHCLDELWGGTRNAELTVFLLIRFLMNSTGPSGEKPTKTTRRKGMGGDGVVGWGASQRAKVGDSSLSIRRGRDFTRKKQTLKTQ